ncbi:MAG: hypothetical protein IJY18_00330 [Clostridia bacterium]|nr:hypothetical protein [Clostridia bacterium]
MAKKIQDSVYDVVFNERDAEILRLEMMKADIEEDIETAISEFVKISKKRKFKEKKRKKKKLCKLLLDGKNPDAI